MEKYVVKIFDVELTNFGKDMPYHSLEFGKDIFSNLWMDYDSVDDVFLENKNVETADHIRHRQNPLHRGQFPETEFSDNLCVIISKDFY
jgi:hypothetical protein